MSDDPTINNENADARERAADATERQAGAMDTLVDAIKRANEASQKTTAELEAQIKLLQDSDDKERTLYESRVRNQKIAELRFGILENELKILDDIVKKGGTLNEEDAKRYQNLSKNLSKMKSAHQANNDLIEKGGSAFDEKVGGAVMRVADMLQRDLNSQLSAMGNLIDAAAAKGIGILKNEFISLVKELDSLTANFERQTQLGPAYTESINRQYRAMNQFGVSMEEAFGAQTALITSMTDFTLLGQAQRDSISEAGLLLQEQGIAIEDFSKGMQNSTKFFGQSAEMAIMTQQELAQTAEALGKVPAELAAEFAAAGPQLAKFGDQGVQAFKDLSRISKITGMDMDKVLAITNRFDTFEGAAEQAGKLNAAMGANMVNAMDLMMDTDPASRFETLRESIMNTVGSFDDMSYYQKQFYTEALGLGDVSDLALMMAGNMDMLDGAQNQNAETLIKQREEAQRVQSAQEKLQLTMAELVEDYLEPAADAFKSIATMLQENVGFIKALVKAYVLYKLITVPIKAFQTFSLMYQTKSMSLTAANTKLQLAQNAMLAKQTAALTSVTAAITAKTTAEGASVPVSAAFSGSMVTGGTAAAAATPPFVAFGAAALKVGAAVLMAGIGIGAMAAAFSLLNLEQLIGIPIALLALAQAAAIASPAIVSLATAMVSAAPALLAAAPGLTVLAAFTASMAGSIFIVSAGIALMAAGLATVFTVIEIDKALALGGLIVTLMLASPGLLAAGLGFVGVGAGMLLFAGALAMISSSDLESISKFATGMAEMDVSNVNALVTALRGVADAMDDIPTAKAIALTATMNAAEMAVKAAGALTTQAPVAQAATAAQQAKQTIHVDLRLELDGDALKAKIVDTTTNEQSSGGMIDIITNILN